MAVDTVRSALEFRRLSDEGFATRFAGELAWLTMSFPGTAPDQVAQRTIAMFRRQGEAVRNIFTEAAAIHANNLVDHTLPESCLLQLVVNSPDIPIDHEPIATPLPGTAKKLPATEEYNEGPIRLAVDDVGKRIMIDGLAPLAGPTEFRLVSVLVQLHREDREAERAPENYRTMQAEDLAEAASSTGDVAGRKAISRLRGKINREYEALYGSRLDSDSIIESVRGRGYRLNPAVRIVASDQLG
jgi:hypothetical protein